MIEMIKIASNQLDRTPDYQVVKVAGILRRLKNVFKSYFDPEFKDQVEKLEIESAKQEEDLKDLVEQIDKVQIAIKDKELDEYREELDRLNKLMHEVYQKNLKLKDSASKINNKFSTLPREEQNKAALPENYDVPLNKEIHLPFKDSAYYSSILYKVNFNLAEAPIRILKDRISKMGFEEINVIPSTEINSILKSSIFNGKINFAEFHPSEKSQEPGVISLHFTSEPFRLPGYDYNLIIQGRLTDLTTGKVRRPIISYQRTDTINRAGFESSASNRSDFYFNILKKAQEYPPEDQRVDQFINKLDGLTFAKALEKGYQKSQGKKPTLEILAFGWAQAATESYDGIVFNLKNNNVGNLRAFPDWINAGGKYFAMKHMEILDGKKVLDTKAIWRSYESPEDGAAEYWRLLFRKFPQAVELAASGKHHEAVTELGTQTKQHGKYFTADVDKYSAAVQKFYKKFMDEYAKNFSNLPKSHEENYLEKEFISKSPKPVNDQDDEIDLSTPKAASYLLTNFVKQSLYKQNNPKKYLLIKVEGSDRIDNLEYASNLSYLIQDYLNGTTTIHKNNNNIQIEASANTNSDFRKAVFELSELLSNEINKKINKNVYTVIANDLTSFYPEISIDDLSSNHRKFLMRYS